MVLVWLALGAAALAVIGWLAMRRGPAGWLGRLAVGALAVLATVAAIQVYDDADGFAGTRGFLGKAIALLVGAVAVGLWVAFAGTVALWWRRRRDPALDADVRTGSGGVLLVALGSCALLALVGVVLDDRGRLPHADGLADARLAADASRLWSLGTDGALFEWRFVAMPQRQKRGHVPSPYRVERRHRVAGVPADARLAVLHGGFDRPTLVATLAQGRLRTYALVPDGGDARAVADRTGVRAVVAAGSAFVLATGEGVEWLSSDGRATTLPWHAPVEALAANALGDVVFADATGQLVHVRDGRPRPLAEAAAPVTGLEFDATGRQLLAIAADGLLAVDLPSGASRPLRGLGGAEFATPADGARMLLCHRAAIQCTWVDLGDGTSGAGFSGGGVKEYRRVDGSPQVALLVGADSLYVQTLGRGQGFDGATLRDPRLTLARLRERLAG